VFSKKKTLKKRACLINVFFRFIKKKLKKKKIVLRRNKSKKYFCVFMLVNISILRRKNKRQQ